MGPWDSFFPIFGNNKKKDRNEITLMELFAWARRHCESSVCILSFSPYNSLIKMYCSWPHFINNRTKAQRGDLTSVGPHSFLVFKSGIFLCLMEGFEWWALSRKGQLTPFSQARLSAERFLCGWILLCGYHVWWSQTQNHFSSKE